MTLWTDTLNARIERMNQMSAARNYSAAGSEAAAVAELLFTEAQKAATVDRKNYLANRGGQFLELSVDLHNAGKPKTVVTKTGGTQPQEKRQRAEKDGEESPQFSQGQTLMFSDIAGLENVKQTLLDYVETFRHIEAARKRGLTIGGGLLFYGPPGTGKTMLAKAVAGELGLPFYLGVGSELLSQYYGQSVKNVAALFEQARSEPDGVVLFIDEIDSLARKRTGNTHGATLQILTHLLQELDGAGSRNDKMVFLAATNNPWDIDEALMSRLSETCYVPLPDDAARKAIFELRFAKMPVADKLPIDELVAKTAGMGGREIVSICERANKISFRKMTQSGIDEPVTAADFATAMENIQPRVSQKSLQKYADWTNRK